MGSELHLLKLSVGSENLQSLHDWQFTRMAQNEAAGLGRIHTHVTRMWPRREAELLDGGSIYWVIKGTVRCRQRILGLQERRGEDGIRRCAIVLEPKLVRTTPQPRRAFQGWRYLTAEDAPADLGPFEPGASDLPHGLENALSEIGVF